MSCLSRCPYFRGVLNEGFHCVHVCDCLVSTQVHFIIQFKNPVTGEMEEKHSKQSTESMEFFDDKKTHLFTLCKW